jgi:DNA (cytosine-5)-methyltransferase 1
VFVVGCLGDWRSAAEVLFEPESLRRDSPPSREKGQAASTSFVPSVASCLETTSHDYSRADGFNMIAAPIALAENTIGRQPQNGGNGDGFTVGGPMYTLNATGVHGVAQPVYELHSQDSRVTELKDVCGTVSATYGMGGGNVPVTIQPIAFEPGKLKRLGYGYAPAGLAPTLRAGAGDNQLAIAQPTVLMDQGGSVMSVLEDGTVGTLRRETHGHEPVVMAPTLTASNDPSRSPQSTEVTNQVAAVHAASMAVRRLTPVECERLQGFPDNYTNITWRKQPESPDGPRYKALGNSMAVPVMAWIGRRIANVA